MMKRLLLAVLLLGLHTVAVATPNTELLDKVTKHVVKVKVKLNNGKDGMGSGVVIAKDRIVTNCHVVANASSINVIAGDVTYHASSITPDWYHDICLVKVEGLNAPVATIGKSENLQYQQAVFAIGYPNLSMNPATSYGHVKSLLPMDDSVIVRATSAFKRGQSGGGLFDDAGNLVAVITLKSPGKDVYYYNMPVEWIQALLDKPDQAINSNSAPAFWAVSSEKWPFFMQVVHPYLTKNWSKLLTLATEWTKQEPDNQEAWFYLAAAEYAIHDLQNAESHMRKVTAKNGNHSQAIYYLALIAEQNGKHKEALTNIALLTTLDASAANELKSVVYD
jgi:serine protease Do